MEEQIRKHLSDLEQDKGIKILLACETGSRAWGFPSPDSDYDIRLIYKHDKDWYLSLAEKRKDTIELFLDNNLIDISGWDLRKSLRLLWKSNAPLLERIQSPVIYKADKDFLSEVNSMAQKAYSRIAVIHHYLSMAKNTLNIVVDSEEYKLKKLFYALRASVACLWILEKEELPPIAFSEMYHALDVSANLKTRITELIKLKSTISEAYLHKGEPELIEFMKDCIERANNEAQSLPASKMQSRELDDFFRKTLG